VSRASVCLVLGRKAWERSARLPEEGCSKSDEGGVLVLDNRAVREYSCSQQLIMLKREDGAVPRRQVGLPSGRLLESWLFLSLPLSLPRRARASYTPLCIPQTTTRGSPHRP
jgi:hypothetical protein